jgi:hypothetical protein
LFGSSPGLPSNLGISDGSLAVWRAIEESDGSDHLKFSTDPGGPGWLRKVTVYSHAGTGDFGGEVPSVNQWDHKQFAYNAKIWADSVVGVEASNS